MSVTQIKTELKGLVKSDKNYPTLLAKTGANAYTLTAQEVNQNNLIQVIYTSGTAVTVTLPTAALLVASDLNVSVGDIIEKKVYPGAVDAVITVAVGTGGTLLSSGAAVAGKIAEIVLRFTNVTSGAEAYTVYLK